VKKNFLMILSIMAGVGASMFAVYSAAKRIALAAGSNLERLQALYALRKAIGEKDADAFESAAKSAKSGGMSEEEIQEEAVALEVALGYKCAGAVVDLTNKTGGGVYERLVAQVKDYMDANPTINPEAPYCRARRTLAFAEGVAKRRIRTLQEWETPESQAVIHGYEHEGRRVKQLYNSRRRTVEFAVDAQKRREENISRMLVSAPGYCVGSVPKTSGTIPDAKWGKVQDRWEEGEAEGDSESD